MRPGTGLAPGRLPPQGKLDHTAFNRDFRTATTTEVTATPLTKRDRKSAGNAVKSLARTHHNRRLRVLDLKQYPLDAD